MDIRRRSQGKVREGKERQNRIDGKICSGTEKEIERYRRRDR